MLRSSSFFFFFNDTATTEIYTLSLHDALPICRGRALPRRPRLHPQAAHGLRRGHAAGSSRRDAALADAARLRPEGRARDRKSTRLNSSHANISYAVFCLKKKKKKQSRNIALNY